MAFLGIKLALSQKSIWLFLESGSTNSTDSTNSTNSLCSFCVKAKSRPSAFSAGLDWLRTIELLGEGAHHDGVVRPNDKVGAVVEVDVKDIDFQ